MKDDIAASVAKAVPPVGANFWLWLTGHDINWWVGAATLIYIGLQGYVLIRDKLVHRAQGDDDTGEVPHA